MPTMELVCGDIDSKIIKGREYIFNDETQQYDIMLETIEEIQQTYGVNRAYSDLLRIFNL